MPVIEQQKKHPQPIKKILFAKTSIQNCSKLSTVLKKHLTPNLFLTLFSLHFSKKAHNSKKLSYE